jgi:hypothetical protein
MIDGRHQQLVGVLQERYGIEKEIAESEIAEFLKTIREEVASRSGDRENLRRAM